MDNREWEVSSAQIRKAHGYAAPAEQRRLFEQAHEAEELARDIMKLARNTLLIHLRFLESAFVRLVPGKETVTSEIATDGQFLYYNSVHICRQFQKGREIPARDYLHVVLHCLFRHLFVGPRVNPDFWDLACDIAVENIITGLGVKSLSCPREEEQRWLLEKLREELPGLTAERIYRYLLDQQLPVVECARLRASFYADDHKIWHKEPEAARGAGDPDQRDTAKPPDASEEDAGNPDDTGEDLTPPPEADGEEELVSAGGLATGEEAREGEGEGGSVTGDLRQGEKPALSPEEIQQMWREIAQRVEVDFDTFSNTWGENAGDMRQALKEVNREKHDYGEFLRRFAVLGENMEVNDDEFDYIFYTYGLRMYGRMPLVESLEYKEVKRVRELVVALDTSQSVAGDLVQKFVTKTWNILKQTQNFFHIVNVHILQCGARVEEDAKITCQDDFDAYMKRMVLRGFGGTDFRPVFEYVNGMIKQHEFQNFKGLIYFTDGYGTFPAQPPDYETAFIFLDQGREPPDVPPWAMRLLLEEEQLSDIG